MEETIKKYGKKGYGWKVLKKYDDGLYAENYHDGFRPYVIRKRYEAVPSEDIAYPCGFHIFKTRASARKWAGYPDRTSFSKLWTMTPVSVRKVKWSCALASGTQGEEWGKVIVAKYMTILPLKEKKK
jgi:hypothetical protein